MSNGMKIFMTCLKGVVQIKLSAKVDREEVPVETINTLREKHFPEVKEYQFSKSLTGDDGGKLIIYDETKDLTSIRVFNANYYRADRNTADKTTGSLAKIGDVAPELVAAAGGE